MKSNILTVAAILSIFVSIAILIYEKQGFCLALYFFFLIVIRVLHNKGDIPKALQKRLKEFQDEH